MLLFFDKFLAFLKNQIFYSFLSLSIMIAEKVNKKKVIFFKFKQYQ